ncbi:MAG TPA: F0F1 ATP synthase subunit delta [Candidatus Saccharimonadales bacterium]|nr:F0F1 ATP synthase subunit delta [Candidatus Saccharimonadales bacterium]
MNSKASRRVIARTVAAKLLAEPTQRRHWITALAAYLVEANRVDEVDLVVNDIAHELFEQKGLLVVDVTSARPMTDQVKSELIRVLKDATAAKEVSLTETVNSELLGGLIARTPDAQLDASVRTKLRMLAAIK